MMNIITRTVTKDTRLRLVSFCVTVMPHHVVKMKNYANSIMIFEFYRREGKKSFHQELFSFSPRRHKKNRNVEKNGRKETAMSNNEKEFFNVIISFKRRVSFCTFAFARLNEDFRSSQVTLNEKLHKQAERFFKPAVTTEFVES